jgi:sodium-dependent phosphate transporter
MAQVSCRHSNFHPLLLPAVGAVMGFSLVYGGADAIVWAQRKDEFPYLSGVAVIVMSWFISPVACGVVASTFFLLVRTIVLRRQNSMRLAFWLLPVLVFITVYINAFFVMFKGAAGKYASLGDSPATCAWMAAICGAGATLFTIVVVMPFLNKKLKAWMAG